ncbi:MAG TPA: dienelactone hydrolase family protein [Candidatus Binataceae bacterium]|nr:dienelactone hydrolase family protein [Candidatus Binataceae bacterium]
MKHEDIRYQDGDVNCHGLYAYDEHSSARRPGVLIMPDAFGLGPFVKERAERLAKLGYVGFGADPYGDRLVAKDLPEGIKYAMALLGDPAKVRRRVRAALDKLAALPQVDPKRLAVMGYCMGGTCSLEIARDGAALSGVVSFHGGLGTAMPAAAGAVKAKVLVCNGAEDPFVPPEQLAGFTAEMTKAGVDWQVINYGGTVHSFTNPEADLIGAPGIKYNEQTDRRSWQAMSGFFKEIFGA